MLLSQIESIAGHAGFRLEGLLGLDPRFLEFHTFYLETLKRSVISFLISYAVYYYIVKKYCYLYLTILFKFLNII